MIPLRWQWGRYNLPGILITEQQGRHIQTGWFTESNTFTYARLTTPSCKGNCCQSIWQHVSEQFFHSSSGTWLAGERRTIPTSENNTEPTAEVENEFRIILPHILPQNWVILTRFKINCPNFTVECDPWAHFQTSGARRKGYILVPPTSPFDNFAATSGTIFVAHT